MPEDFGIYLWNWEKMDGDVSDLRSDNSSAR